MGAGQPPKYKTPEDLQKKIDEYFDGGMDTIPVVVGRGATKKVIQLPVPTITGLVLFCGFADRQSFYDYEKRDKFSCTIKNARTRIEKQYEQMIYSSPNPAGAIFALKNFGWTDTAKNEIDGELIVKIVRE